MYKSIYFPKEIDSLLEDKNFIKGVSIKEIETSTDKRGLLMELYRADTWNEKPPMCYVSITNPGFIRGPHEHKYQTDCFAFIGKGIFDFYLWDNRKDSETYKRKVIYNFSSNNPSLIIVPPGVVHGYKNTSLEEGFVLNFPDSLYKGWGKSADVDEIRHENDLNSEFII